jgi:hypothetical protein
LDAGDGMDDVELFAVEGGAVNQGALGVAGLEMVAGLETGEEEGRAAVDRVADDRKAQVPEMDADLTGAA